MLCAPHSHRLCVFRSPLTHTPMANPLAIEVFRVEHAGGFSMPRITLANRRAGGAVPRMIHWVCQRHLEILLFGRVDGGSSGAIWKILNVSALGSTSLCCARKAVDEETITDEEFTQIMAAFKQALPAEMCDPSSLGRIRSCTLLPIATAALVCRQHGRSSASLAWLRAFSQPVPDSWLMHEQSEANAANGVEDLLLKEQLDDASFEVEDISFQEELTSMPAFQAVADDEQRMSTYILQRVPPALAKDLSAYISYRTATFAARRQGGAVQSISAEADRTQLLRFFGYLDRTNRIPDGQLLDITLMIRCRPWRHRLRVRLVAAEHAALPLQLHCQLPQRLDQHHVLLLCQPRANRRRAQHGSQSLGPADQLAWSGREGLQDAAALRQARRRLVRVARRAEGAAGGGEEARDGGSQHPHTGVPQRAARRRCPLPSLAHPTRPCGLHPQAAPRPHAQAEGGRRLEDGPLQAARRPQDLAVRSDRPSSFT